MATLTDIHDFIAGGMTGEQCNAILRKFKVARVVEITPEANRLKCRAEIDAQVAKNREGLEKS